MDDNLIIDPREMPALQSVDEAANFIREKIENVRDIIKNEPPPPTNQLNALGYIQWERRMLMLHGRAMGALESLQAFGHISIPVFQELKNQIIGTMLRRVAAAQMGTDNG